MAQRRMFSPDIVNSDAFLEMPPSTQALYFQLGMKADDDGFVNPKMVMRTIGSTEDEIKVLLGKRFVLPFENGVIVIKHWRVNNLVRKDWYKPSIYSEQKKNLLVKPNGIYTTDPKQGVPLFEEPRQQSVNEPSTQVRLGKVRLGKVIDTNTRKTRVDEAVKSLKAKKVVPQTVTEPKLLAEIMEGFKAVNPSIYKLYGNVTQRKALDRMIALHGAVKVKQWIELLPIANSKKYAPTITTPNQLEDNLGKLASFFLKEQDSGKGKKMIE